MIYDQVVTDEHAHEFEDNICTICGMHREELFVTLSGVFPDEREETDDPWW